MLSSGSESHKHWELTRTAACLVLTSNGGVKRYELEGFGLLGSIRRRLSVGMEQASQVKICSWAGTFNVLLTWSAGEFCEQ